MRNKAYPIRKEHAKKYINRLLRLGYTFECASHVRFVEVTVNEDAEPPKEEWKFDMTNSPVYDL